jgi:uncharacterized membrane protein
MAKSLTNNKTKQIATIAILIALTVALQFFSNYINFGTVNINLALIVIIVGAIIYGPWVGGILGVVDGIIIIVAPSTLAYFWPINPVMTIILCLLKTGLAGVAAGFAFLPFRGKENKYELIGSFVSSIVTPVVNTTLFIVGASIFFLSVYGNSAQVLITGVLSVNFAIETTVVVLLAPAVHQIVKIVGYKYQTKKMAKKEEASNNNLGE